MSYITNNNNKHKASVFIIFNKCECAFTKERKKVDCNFLIVFILGFLLKKYLIFTFEDRETNTVVVVVVLFDKKISSLIEFNKKDSQQQIFSLQKYVN